MRETALRLGGENGGRAGQPAELSRAESGFDSLADCQRTQAFQADASQPMTPLSIVMPAHNEAEHIEQCVSEWHSEVISKVPGSELIVVDDCSTDGTAERLRAMAESLPQLRVLQTPQNSGHGRAVRYGLDRCSGEFVFQTDSDRQHIPEDFWRLWELRQTADLVLGRREQRADGLTRRLISTGLRVCNAMLWGLWIRDANCPFKLMRGSALRSVLSAIPGDAFIPMVMVSVLARHMKYSVAEVPVRHLPRTAGQQSLKGIAKWIRVGSACAAEMLKLRFSVIGRTFTPSEQAVSVRKGR